MGFRVYFREGGMYTLVHLGGDTWRTFIQDQITDSTATEAMRGVYNALCDGGHVETITPRTAVQIAARGSDDDA